MNENNSLLRQFRKFVLVLLAFVIIITGYFLIDSIRSTKTVDNQAAPIIAGQCLPANNFCQWDSVSGENIEYEYRIIDTTSGVDIEVTSGKTASNSIDFQPVTDHTYICQVKAVQDCKSSADFTSSSASTCEAGAGAENPEPISQTPVVTSVLASTTPTARTIRVQRTTPTPTTSQTESNPSTPSATLATKQPTSTPFVIPTKSAPLVTTPSPERVVQLPQAGLPTGLLGSILAGAAVIVLGFLF